MAVPMPMRSSTLNAGALASFLLVLVLSPAGRAQEPVTAPPPAALTDAPKALEDLESPTLAAPTRVGAFEPGFRSGIDLPWGSAGNGSGASTRSLSDLTAYRVPLWVELFYRTRDDFRLGVYGQVGLGAVGDSCEGDCSWSQLRLGAQGEWELSRGKSTVTWLGVGLGYQWLAMNGLELFDTALAAAVDDGFEIPSDIPDDFSPPQTLRRIERLSGPELLVHGGLDFTVEPGLGVGPYLAASVSTFLGNSRSCPGLPSVVGELCTDVSDEGSRLHGWIGVGLRGSYLP